MRVHTYRPEFEGGNICLGELFESHGAYDALQHVQEIESFLVRNATEGIVWIGAFLERPHKASKFIISTHVVDVVL